MSVALNGSNQYLDVSTPKSAYPYSISFWFKTSDVSQSGGNGIMISNDAGTSGDQNQCHLRGDQTNYPIAVASYDSAWRVAYSVSPYPQNSTWHHACVVFTSSTSRHVLLDGASKASNSGTASATSVNYLTIGCRFKNNPQNYYTGSMAEVAFYTIALSDTDVGSLAAGADPNTVQSASLLSYHRLYDDNSEDGGGTSLTEHNSPTYSTSDHPSVGVGKVNREPTFTGTGSLIVTPTIFQRREPTLSGKGSLDVTPTVTNINDIGFVLPDKPIWMRQAGWNPGVIHGSTGNFNNPKPQIIAPFFSGTVSQGSPAAARAQKFNGYGPMDKTLLWYETAHLLPRIKQELGNIITDQAFTCELYNSHVTDSITVSSITNNLGNGVEVTGVPAVPFNIKPRRSELFTVTVKRTGDLTINGTYTMTLSTGETYTLYFTGTRIVLFPIRPEAPLREHLLFDTKILEAVDGSEQRISNRQFPRGLFEATYKSGQREIEMLLFDRQAQIVAWPAWHQPAFCTSTHALGATTINVDTTAYSNLYVGGYAVIIDDQYTFDAVKITAMTATTLTVETGLSYNYTARAEVLPLFTAFIEANTASLKYAYNQQYFNLRIHTHAVPNDIADASTWNTYNSKVFLDDPNMIDGGQLAEALRTKVFVLDNESGWRTQLTAWAHNKRYSKKGFKTNTRQEAWVLRQLFHELKAKQVSFYIPTFSKDIVPNQALTIGTYTVNMDYIGYTTNAKQRWPKQVVRVVLKDGTKFFRTIQNSAVVSNKEEQLTLNDSWPATYQPDDVERIEFLEKVRLDTDDIIMVHLNALGQTETIVPIKEVVD